MMRDQKARMARDLSLAAMRDLPMPGAASSERPAPPLDAEPPERPEAPSVWPGTLLDRLEARLLGGVREDGDDFQKRIVKAPRPAYPEIARKAGIEGLVRLQVRLSGDGKIEVQKLLEGEPVLADAAMTAVKQWRGKPVWMDGKPVDVISTVSFRFQLR
jgi:TonB family protein